jgi:hypothetical protein
MDMVFPLRVWLYGKDSGSFRETQPHAGKRSVSRSETMFWCQKGIAESI